MTFSMTSDDKKESKQNDKYFCECCQYSTQYKKDYTKHLSTAKHKNRTKNQEVQTTAIKQFICECGNNYKSRQGLHRHKKTCTFIKKTVMQENNVIINTNDKIFADL